MNSFLPYFLASGSGEYILCHSYKYILYTYVTLVRLLYIWGACSCVEYGALEFKRADLLFVKSSRFHHFILSFFFLTFSGHRILFSYTIHNKHGVKIVFLSFNFYALSCLISIFSRHFRSSRSIALSVSHPCRQAQLTRGTFQISNGSLHSHIPFVLLYMYVCLRNYQGVVGEER